MTISITIYIFYKYKDDFKTLVKKQILLNLYFLGILGFLNLIVGLATKDVNLVNNLIQTSIQVVSLISLFIIKKYEKFILFKTGINYILSIKRADNMNTEIIIISSIVFIK